MFYAVEYAYGSHVVNCRQRADLCFRFVSRQERGCWLEGGSWLPASMERRPLPRAHPSLRALLRNYGDYGDVSGGAWCAGIPIDMTLGPIPSPEHILGSSDVYLHSEFRTPPGPRQAPRS